jgi:hypothetical protein
VPPEHDVLAVEFKINLLRPATARHFVAEARVLRAGRTLVVSFAEVWGESDSARDLVATMLSTVIARPSPPDELRGRVDHEARVDALRGGSTGLRVRAPGRWLRRSPRAAPTTRRAFDSAVRGLHDTLASTPAGSEASVIYPVTPGAKATLVFLPARARVDYGHLRASGLAPELARRISAELEYAAAGERPMLVVAQSGRLNFTTAFTDWGRRHRRRLRDLQRALPRHSARGGPGGAARGW